MKTLKRRQIPGPKSAEILEIARRYEPAYMGDTVPVVWDHAEGVWVTDVDGNEYVDFTSGVLVTNLGHSHPAQVAAVQAQAARLMNCYSFASPQRVKLSQRLVEILPPNLDKVFLLSTGAEATEAALRVARRFTGKQEVLAFFGAFHGRTYGAMAVAGTMSTRRGFGQTVPGSIMAPYPSCYRCFYGRTYPECDLFCIKKLDEIVGAESSGDLGTVIVEPYQGTAGFIFPPEGWLAALADWAHERKLVLIVDEVQSSFGRTGKMFAIEWENVQPELLCLGKGFGSGVPTAAVAGESRVFASMSAGELSSTWGGNPLASASALAVLDAMHDEHLPERAQQMGDYLGPRLRELQAHHPSLGDVRGKGLVFGLDLVSDRDERTPAPDLTRNLLVKAAERGLLLGRVGVYGNVVRVAPPLVIGQEEIDLAVDVLDGALTELGG